MLHGTGPDIVVSRTFSPGWRTTLSSPEDNFFADWQLNLPRISTDVGVANTGAYASFGGYWAGFPGSVGADQRCDHLPSAPSLPVNNSDLFDVTTWWNGDQLVIPGAGSQTILRRENGLLSPTMTDASGTAMTFGAFTLKHWMIGCTPTTASGEPGQGFLVIAPDGTRYTLNWLTYQWGLSVHASSITTPVINATAQTAFASALVTRVEDRFGNWVNYQYAGSQLQHITASDGRQVDFFWRPETAWIDHINVVDGAGHTRTWSYTYANESQLLPNTRYYLGRLSAVTLPDGSSWGFNLGGLLSASVGPASGNNFCVGGYFDAANQGRFFVGSMTAPSGLSGTFTLTPTQRVRVGIVRRPAGCNSAEVPYFVPGSYFNDALVSKSFSGAGINQTWSYAYSNPPMYFADQCAGGVCPQHVVTTDATDPDGVVTRYSYDDTLSSFMEGKLVQTQYGFNASTGSALRTELSTYADPATGGPFNNPIGAAPDPLVNENQQGDLAPEAQHDIIEANGDHFVWKAEVFNAYGQPIKVLRSNNVAGQSASEEQTTLLNDTNHWVLGLSQQLDNLTTGETVSHTDYDPSSITPTARYSFGQKLMSYSFNAQGQLATFTDGNAMTTTLSNYARGIPQAIAYPDGRSQAIGVDGFGQVASITDQAGNTTSYGYDAIGRLSGITYPAGDTVAWAPKTFGYVLVGSERGVTGNHWRRTVTQGGEGQLTEYDAMLRPVLTESYRATDGALGITARADYDWKGNKTFASFPVAGGPDLGAITAGVTTIYDALGRATTSQQPSELGTLTTSTAYLSGERKQVTDPKGYVTTTAYQVFDQPSYDKVIEVLAPEGVTQTIGRDIYGNPLSITQGGNGVSITKSMTYDANKRLCRTTEPESGSEVMAYDAANNLAWSASGLAITGTGCGQEQVAAAAMTTRTYDPMNRVLSVIYPTGTDSTTFTYDPLGNPGTATSGLTSWTYGRNKLGLLTAEVLSVEGYQWSLGYGYDPNGSLSTIAYPDGKVVSYAPDALGRATQVGSYANGVSYFPDGDVQGFTFGNGATYVAEKNARNILSNFTYGKGGALAVSEDLVYDPNANISQITDLTNNGQRTKVLGYDQLNRLTSATASNLWGTESYTYDTLNNIRSLTNSGGTNTYNYDTNNLLQAVINGGTTVHAFQYDPRGNTIKKNNVALTFDQANRLTAIQDKGTYLYDAAGRRVKKLQTGAAAPTYYAYSQAGQLMFQYDPSTTKATDYLYLGKKLVTSTENISTHVTGAVALSTAGTAADVYGWSCSTGTLISLQVNLYVGGPPGTGTLLTQATANLASEPAVAALCQTQGASYRFDFPLSDAVRGPYVNQPIYVQGISPVGGDNVVLPGSGFLMPPSSLAPLAPSSLSVQGAASYTSLTISWPASAGATSYNLQQKVNGGAWTALYSGAAATASVSNPPDGGYIYQVEACNANGCSTWTGSGTTNVVHIPPTPTIINVPTTATGAISVSWSTSIYATSYTLQQSVNGGAWTTVFTNPANGTVVFDGVTGTDFLRVQACSADGCSGFITSAPIAVTIPPATGPSVSVPAISNNGCYTVSWTGVAGATVYYLNESTNGAAWVNVQANGATTWSVCGKPNGTYSYYAVAYNAGGFGPNSNFATVTVALIPSTPSECR